MVFRSPPPVLGALALSCILLAITLARLAVGAFWPVPFSVDEAQYVSWSRELAAGYYSKPPFIAWALAAAQGLCATGSEACARSLQPLAFFGAAVALALATSKLLSSRHSGLWAGLLLCSSPLAAFYSQAASTDAWLLLWWSCAFCAFVFASSDARQNFFRAQDDRLEWWMACGLFVGLALLTKYSAGVFILSAFIWLLASGQLFRRGPWLALGTALIVFLPNLLWNAKMGWPTFQHHAGITLASERSGMHWDSLWTFFEEQWLVFGPIVFGVFLLSLTAAGRARARPGNPDALGLALCFSLPMLAVIGAQSLISRAHANWAAPALVGICLAVTAYCSERYAGRWIARWVLGGALTLNLLFNAALLSAPWTAPALGLSGSRATDPFIRLSGFKDVALLIKQLEPQHEQTPLAPPALTIASTDRDILANFSAYLPEARVLAWNPKGYLAHHWDLQHDLARSSIPREERILLVIRRLRDASAEHIAQQEEWLDQWFSSVAPLGSTHPELARELAEIKLSGKSDVLLVGFWVRQR